MKNLDTIKKHHEFKQIMEDGKKIVTPEYVLYTLPRDKFVTNYKYKEQDVLYGILVSRKLGKAHERNLAKRRIRHKLHSGLFASDIKIAYIFIPRFMMAK